MSIMFDGMKFKNQSQIDAYRELIGLLSKDKNDSLDEEYESLVEQGIFNEELTLLNELDSAIDFDDSSVDELDIKDTFGDNFYLEVGSEFDL